MIRKEDFVNAIGMPDSGFEQSVKTALYLVRESERRAAKRKHSIKNALIAAAASILIIASLGLLLAKGGSGSRPDKVTSEGTNHSLHTPAAEENFPVRTAAPIVTPEPTPEHIEMATINDELLPSMLPTVEPTPSPERAAEDIVYSEVFASGTETLSEPVGIELFISAFGQELNALYEGYAYLETRQETRMYRGEQNECECWYVSNGEQEICACTLGNGEINIYDEAINRDELITLSVDMPDDNEAIHKFLDNAPDNMRIMFERSYEITKSTLAGIRVSFSETDNRMMFCEFFFGDSGTIYLLWSYNENYLKNTKKYDEYELIHIDQNADEVTGYFNTGAPISEITPHGYDWFLTAFGCGIEYLYPDYNFICTTAGQRVLNGKSMDCTEWYFGDDEIQECIAWISSWNIMSGQSYGDNMLSVVLPDDIETVNSFVMHSTDDIKQVFEKSCDYVAELYGTDERPVPKGVYVLFADDDKVYAAGIYFGGNTRALLYWSMHDGEMLMSNLDFDDDLELAIYFGAADAVNSATEETAYESEYEREFYQIFLQSPMALYDGVPEKMYYEKEDNNIYAYVSGNNGEKLVMWVNGETSEKGYGFTASVYMSDHSEKTDGFMSGASPQLQNVFYENTVLQMEMLC